MSAGIPNETQEQIWLMKWGQQPTIRRQHPDLKYLYHIPNERSDKRQAAILKKMGVKRGVPDLCLPVARGKYHGLYIEMKRSDGGTVSDDQLWWNEQLNANGYASVICDGWESGKEALLWYLNLPIPQA